MNAIVIGAGVVGLSVAFDLASRGAGVRVIDARPPGQGATQASAGMLAPRIEATSGPLLTLGLCSLQRFDAFIERLTSRTHLSIEYGRAGSLQVACSPDQVGELSDAARLLTDSGVPHALMDGKDARRREPGLSSDVVGALEVGDHGHVGVADLLRALERGCRDLGVEFLLGNVHAMIPHASGPVVETTVGVLRGDTLVIAAGAWTDTVAVPGRRPAIVHPVRGQLLHLRVSEGLASRVIWGPGCYLVPWSDGSVLVGATVEEVGFDERSTVEGIRGLMDAGVRLLPALSRAELVHVRVGLRPATRDGLPVIGPSTSMPGVFYATGHYRNGVLLAPLTAALIGDLVMGGAVPGELGPVLPARWGL